MSQPVVDRAMPLTGKQSNEIDDVNRALTQMAQRFQTAGEGIVTEIVKAR